MVAILVIALTCILLLQVPRVQARLTNAVLEKFNDKLNGKVQFSAMHLMPLKGLVMDDVVILDDEPARDPSDASVVVDTVFRARCITATFSLKGLLSDNGVHIDKAYVQDAVMNLVIENDNEYKCNLCRVFKLLPKGEQPAEKEIFDIRRVRLDGFRYRMYNFDMPPSEITKSMDWFRLDLEADIKGHNLKFADGIMTGVADEVTIREKCGYEAGHISGKVRVGRGKAEITDIRLKDQWSDVSVPLYRMSYDNAMAFRDFVNEVRIDGIVDRSILDLRTLSAFVPALPEAPVTLQIRKANVNGVIEDLHVTDVEFIETGSRITGKAGCSITGAVAGPLALDASVESLKLTTRGIDHILKTIGIETDMEVGQYAAGETLTFSGKAKGTLDKLNVNGALSSRLGSADTRLTVRHLDGRSPIQVNGNFCTQDLDIGHIMDIDQIGGCTLRAVFDARLGDIPSVQVDTLRVSRFGLFGYDYSGLLAAGTLEGRNFDGRVVCNDPNLNFLFQGVCNLSRMTNNARYKFVASVGFADLHALNIDKRPVSKVSLSRLNADFTRVERGDIDGTIEADGIRLESESGVEDIGAVSIRSHSSEGNHRIGLTSSFADAEFQGTRGINGLISDLRTLTVGRELSVLDPSADPEWRGEQYSARLDMHDSRDLMSFIMPGMYIADSTRVRLNVERDGNVNASLRSSRLAYKEKYLKGTTLSIDNKNSALNCKLSTDKASISDALHLDNSSLLVYADDNSLGVGCYYDNASEEENRGELYLTADLSRDERDSLVVDARTLTSNIYYGGEQWRIKPAGFILSAGSLQVDDLEIENGGQSITLNGGVSRDGEDMLEMIVSDLDLGLANAFTTGNLGIKGSVNASVLLTSPISGQSRLSASLVASDVAVGGYDAEEIRVAAGLNSEKGIELAIANNKGGQRLADIHGFYSPASRAIDADVQLNGFQAGYFSPFVTEIFSRLEGEVSGKIHVGGSLDRPDVKGTDCSISSGLLEVAYTGVPYRFEGPFNIDNHGITFRDVSVKDNFRGTGIVSGGFKYDRFKDIAMDMHINMQNMKCLLLDESDNDVFYGDVTGTGSLSITGPFNSLLMDINASTSGAGELHIPLSATTRSGSSDLLTFKQIEHQGWVDPYEQMMQRIETESKAESDFNVRLKVNVDQATEAFIEIDKASGNVLRGNGSGSMTLDIGKDIFNINGDYTLSNGNFRFSALGLTKRDFTIQDGSSIKFNGDIMDSDLDINALYTLKTSLSKLISDDSSVASSRTVECGINISDKLRNPALGFSIDVPDLNPTIKSQVESALNTDDKLQKQFIALLVTGNFLPDDQSGVTNTSSNILLSNVADIMATQLNNILERLEIPLDLGLNYESSKSGTDIFDVAVSTQLFHNRVVMNGTLGNRRYGATSTSDMVGDIDIEIKLDKSGKVRLTLFSHSADEYTNYLDNLQRNGVGIAYQKEFNSLEELISILTGKGPLKTDNALNTIVIN